MSLDSEPKRSDCQMKRNKKQRTGNPELCRLRSSVEHQGNKGRRRGGWGSLSPVVCLTTGDQKKKIKSASIHLLTTVGGPARGKKGERTRSG